ncbi:MAG: STAS domain-containing protein [Methylobacter sp.]
MATSEDNDLIGYDPLAWMDGDTDKNEDHLVTDEIDSDTTQEGAACDGEMSMSDDYSDGLIGNTEEDLVLDITEDELVINEIEDDNDSALLEAAADDGMAQLPIAAQEDVAEDAAEETGSTQFDLDATLSIQNVVKLHEKLKSFVAVHDQIEINASDVSSIDTATLQLLVSLKKDAAKLQKQVTIIYPSPRFVESAHLLGLLSVLDVHDV